MEEKAVLDFLPEFGQLIVSRRFGHQTPGHLAAFASIDFESVGGFQSMP